MRDTDYFTMSIILFSVSMIILVVFTIVTTEIPHAQETCENMNGDFNSYGGDSTCYVVHSGEYTEYKWIDSEWIREAD